MTPTRKSYAVEIKIKNNYLMEKMQENGYENINQVSMALFGHQSTDLGHLMNLKKSAKNKFGQWRPLVMKVADLFKCFPEDLFPPQHIDDPLAINRAVVKADIADIKSLTFSMRDAAKPALARIEWDETRMALMDMLEGLAPREKEMIGKRYGLNGPEMTLDQLSKEYKITKERIRQIEMHALRKMRHKARFEHVDGKEMLREMESND